MFSEIFDKYKDLEELEKALNDLIQDLPREDTQNVKDQHSGLQSQWEDLCKRAKACNAKLADSVSNWQKYQGAVEQMVLWLDMAEPRLEPEASSCSSLDQLENRLADVQVGMNGCTRFCYKQLLLCILCLRFILSNLITKLSIITFKFIEEICDPMPVNEAHVGKCRFELFESKFPNFPIMSSFDFWHMYYQIPTVSF